MISVDELTTKLYGYPEAILLHYELFQKQGSPDDLNQFIIGLIRFLQDSENTSDAVEVSDGSKLMEDLGIDSITIAEVIFLLEDIFEIEIDNQELVAIATFGELKVFILSKLT
jgi:acyl carrier protein